MKVDLPDEWLPRRSTIGRDVTFSDLGRGPSMRSLIGKRVDLRREASHAMRVSTARCRTHAVWQDRNLIG